MRWTFPQVDVAGARVPQDVGPTRGGSHPRGHGWLTGRCIWHWLGFFVLVLMLTACEGADVAAWKEAQAVGTAEAYEAFLAAHPKSSLRRVALDQLDEPHFEQAKLQNSEAGWRNYLKQHPEGRHVSEAEHALELLMFFQAVDVGTLQALEGFLASFPESTFSEAVKTRIRQFPVLSKLELSKAEVIPVNLLGNPNGKKDGLGIYATLTNRSDRPLRRVIVKYLLLLPDGRLWDQRDVSPVRIEGEEGPLSWKEPLKPGDSRRFWTHIRRHPPEWKQHYKLFVSSVEY